MMDGIRTHQRKAPYHGAHEVMNKNGAGFRNACWSVFQRLYLCRL